MIQLFTLFWDQFSKKYVLFPKGNTYADFSVLVPEDYDIILQSKRSFVVRLKSTNDILKVVKPISYHEKMKFFWCRSRIHKEIRGNLYLASLGFRVPKIFCSGYSLFPFGFNEGLGLYIMENLNLNGFINIDEAIYAKKIDKQTRIEFFTRFIEELNTMSKKSRFIYTDLTLGNVMYNPKTKEVAWIDTGLSSFSKAVQKIKFKNSIIRFVDIHNQHLEDPEAAILNQYIETLP